jgi:large conductance mechanosensitive channel
MLNPASFWNDFKKFAFKGNLLDLAVAVVIGNAFGAVVNSLVKNILMPIISYVVPGGGSYHDWHIGKVAIGPFLGELLNFLVVSLAMFVIVVKVFGTMQNLFSHHSDTPTTKECPYCISTIPFKAIKCPQCTADLDTGRNGQECQAPEPARSA